MDYANLINYHRQRGADVTIASTPADEDHALHLGILQVGFLGWGWAGCGLGGGVVTRMVWSPAHTRHTHQLNPCTDNTLHTLTPPPKVDEDMNVQHFEEKPPCSMLHTMSMDANCSTAYGAVCGLVSVGAFGSFGSFGFAAWLVWQPADE